MAPAAWPPPSPAWCRGGLRFRWSGCVGVGTGLRGGGLAEGAEVLQLALEVGWVLEVLVDAGEPHVGDRVELAEGVEELDADLLALDLALAAGPDRLLDVTGDA